jgi:hypothetical protein
MDTPPQLAGFFLYHRAMRAGAADLVAALGAAAPDLAAIGGWFEHYQAACTIHANAEDTVLWPALVGERPDLATVVEGMDQEHAGLDERLAATAAALRAGDLDAARVAAAALAELITTHLDGEEARAVPALIERFDGDALAGLMAQVQQSAGPDGARTSLPFLLAVADPDEQAAFLTLLPPPVREAYETDWAPAYAARRAAVA